MEAPAPRLDRSADTPLYIQLADSLREAIASGAYPAGGRLPAVRPLAGKLDLNPSTVVAAYRILEQEGRLRTRPGSGVYVETGGAAAEGGPAGPALEPATGAAGRPPVRIDLAAAAPPAGRFPIGDIKRLMNEVLDRDGGAAFEYQESGGYRPLRAAAADHFAAAHGFRPDVADIHIVSGAQQGIDLAAKALLAPGDWALTENPSYRGAVDVFWSRGARVEGLEIGPGGVDPDELAAAALRRRPKLFYLMPCFQTPTTVSYTPEVRRAVLASAAAADFYLVEDDSFSDLAYAPAPGGFRPFPLKAEDAAGRVLYIKSFSKILMPGLRLACLVAPAALRQRIERAKLSSDLSSNGFLQRMLELYLSRGDHERHAERLRAAYGERRDLAVAALAPLVRRGARCSSPAGGLHLWLELPPDVAARDLQAYARGAGCALQREAAYRWTAGPDRHLRLSYAVAEPADFAAGADILAEGIDRLRAAGPQAPQAL
jgi:DNA-binding transcriptional MocR family regulator